MCAIHIVIIYVSFISSSKFKIFSNILENSIKFFQILSNSSEILNISAIHIVIIYASFISSSKFKIF